VRRQRLTGGVPSFTGNGLTRLVDKERGIYEIVLATATVRGTTGICEIGPRKGTQVIAFRVFVRYEMADWSFESAFRILDVGAPIITIKNRECGPGIDGDVVLKRPISLTVRGGTRGIERQQACVGLRAAGWERCPGRYKVL
jgi:hypothetical protein